VNCRQASIFVLFGWYLMLPPQLSGNPVTFNADAPLSKWYFASVYDTAEQCETERETLNQRWLVAVSRNETRHLRRTIAEVKDSQRREKCVSADDPRLEGKGPRLNVPIPILPRPGSVN